MLYKKQIKDTIKLKYRKMIRASFQVNLILEEITTHHLV